MNFADVLIAHRTGRAKVDPFDCTQKTSYVAPHPAAHRAGAFFAIMMASSVTRRNE
jgi:hypothetical protein